MSLVAATGVHDGEPAQNSCRYKSSNNAVGEEFGERAKLAMKGFPDSGYLFPTSGPPDFNSLQCCKTWVTEEGSIMAAEAEISSGGVRSSYQSEAGGGKY